MAPASASLSVEEMHMWRTLFQKTTRPFSYNGSIVPVSLYHAHAVLNQFKTRGDAQNEAAISKIILEIIEACKAEAGVPLTKEIVHAVLQESFNHTAPISTLHPNPAPGASVAGSIAGASQISDSNATTALNSAILANAALNNRAIQNVQQQNHMQGLLSSPAMPMGVLAGSQQLNPASSALLAASSSALGAAAAASVAASTSITSAAAQSPAQPASKKQTSGKNTPSVASAKLKKKSQSPRTTTKPRKGPSPKPSPIAAAALAPDPAPTAAQVSLPQPMPTIQEAPAPTSAAAAGAEGAPGMPRLESMSAEMATQIVETIGRTIDVESIKQRPAIEISESDKNTVREHLALIGQLLDLNINLMPVIFLRTRNPDPIQRIYTINIIYKEQRRLLSEDKYIITANTTTGFIEVLRRFLMMAKEWGNMQQNQQHQPAPGSVQQPAATGSITASDAVPGNAQQMLQPVSHVGDAAAKPGQETPLTNMHPSALTADPSFENFQKAVKHPLDLSNLKLPASKKRTVSKSGSNSGNQTASPVGTSGGLQSTMPFAPAPLALPPNMTRAEFDRLPLDTRTHILKTQQAIMIRQNTMSINGAGGVPGNMPFPHQQLQLQQQQLQQQLAGQAANPLLLAATQGMASAVGADQSAEEQQLQALERDKWNKPLEYLMCVLDRFTHSSEKAGVEPMPILQQVFWPIARKSMSSGWGVVASDAVL
ncbi:hypothetical protein LPJ53_000493 [Coemansia erecta]|uniref:Uncharacterized protein n=1 Tax=Coemansia erecta TaxID=147472 RepID=A0A9W7Y1R2_9FUNG|nr:hypothetical protein LPJ53_000493 [Coemansia erecta]